MTGTPKKKLCWNCEGRVSLEEENCPYCAVYLGPAPDEKGENKNLLAPPYRLVESDEEEVPESPYTSKEKESQEVTKDETYPAVKSDIKEVIYPLGMLSAGTLFFLFGLVLYLFSEEGTLTLSWNGQWWYYYLILAVPMLFLGWRALQRFDQEEEVEPVLEPVAHQDEFQL